MKTIWKYHLPIRDEVRTEMPIGAEILHVGIGPKVPSADGEIYLWALVDPALAPERRVFHVYGTGHLISGPLSLPDYLGTVVQGRFVWHVFAAACLRG